VFNVRQQVAMRSGSEYMLGGFDLGRGSHCARVQPPKREIGVEAVAERALDLVGLTASLERGHPRILLDRHLVQAKI